VKMFDAGKTRVIGLFMMKKCDNALSRFHLIPERNGQTDGRTNGRTDGRTDRFAISISRVSMLTRDKNDMRIKLSLSLHFCLFFCF